MLRDLLLPGVGPRAKHSQVFDPLFTDPLPLYQIFWSMTTVNLIATACA